jgi:beta-glucosidase
MLWLFAAALLRPGLADRNIDATINATLARMSIEDKIDLIGGNDGYFSRAFPQFGIPRMKWSDGPVGMRTNGPAPAYPATVALAATWNPTLAERFGASIGRDGRERGNNTWFAPGVNLARIPQCGRNFEYLGEDPILASRIVVPMIEGCQSQGVAACVKHFALNEHEEDRGSDSSDADERTMRELYFRPFEAAVKEAKTWCLMCAYNKVNQTWCSENPTLLTDILKREWGFQGIVLSDYGATHHTLGAVNAGTDIELPGGPYFNRNAILPLIASGQVKESTIDDKVRRFLRVMYSMDFDLRPQKVTSIESDPAESEATALEIAREGTVLLQNKRDSLPLNPSQVRRIAVVGPNADPAVTGGGGSSYTTPATKMSLLEAIKAQAGPGTTVIYHSLVDDLADTAFRYAGFTLPDGSGNPGLRHDHWNNETLSGTPDHTDVVRSVDYNLDDDHAPQRFSARWTANATFDKSGTIMAVSRSDDGIRVWIDDKQVIDHWNNHGAADDIAGFTVEKGKSYRVRVDYFQDRGSSVAKFGFAWPGAALDRDDVRRDITTADAVICSVGFNDSIETEGRDRTFALPGDQEGMLERLVKMNPRTIVVNNSGAGVDMSPWADRAGAIVQAWYPGGVGSQAVAEILFGKVNPSGKLPTTFPRTLKGTYYESAYPPVNGTCVYTEGLFMGYRWFDEYKAAPLFPFGFGLSYTTFRLGTPKTSRNDRIVDIDVQVKNTGHVTGAETVQAYVQPPGGISRPVRELKAFSRVSAAPGSDAVAKLRIRLDDLRYWDPSRHAWRTEPGTYTVWIGTSSRDLSRKVSFKLGGS